MLERRKRRLRPARSERRGLSHDSARSRHEHVPTRAISSTVMASPSGQRLLRYDRRLGVRFVAGADEAGRARSPGRSSSQACSSTTNRSTAIARVRSRFSTTPSRSTPRFARALLRAVLARRGPDRLSASSPPATSTATASTARTSERAPRCARRPRRPERRSASSTASGSGRSHHRTRRRRRRRHAKRRHRGSVDRRQGDPGSHHATARRALPAIWLLPARRLHHAVPLRRCARARPVRPASTLVCGQVLRVGGPRTGCMNHGERRAYWHYRLRGYRILGTNVRAGRNELDLIVRRGRVPHVRRGEAASRAGGSAARSAPSTPRSGGVCASRARLAVAQPTAARRPDRLRGRRHRGKDARAEGGDARRRLTETFGA